MHTIHPSPGAPEAADWADPTARLLAATEAAGIRYCHWKSNIRLRESLDGAEDLDVLVHREDAAEFHGALAEAGFKLARSTAGIDHPGVLHAFALDSEGRRLHHVHAYFQVVTGDSLVKSYRLPLEAALLAGTQRLHGVRVPPREAELALFVLRIALKHLHPVEIALANRSYDAVIRELDWLEAGADTEAAAALWRDWVPGAAQGEFEAARDAIRERRALVRRIRLGRRLARRLRVWRRLGPVDAALSRLRRVGALCTARFRRRRDLVLQSGGLVVAVVGPKATGKSTLGRALATRIGAHLDLRRVHAGKPPATPLSVVPRLAIPLARRLFPGERPGEYEKPDRRARRTWSLIYVLRMTLLAHDRRALIRHCWRAAAAGAVIVTDRYPSETVGAIDSSCFDDAAIAACRSPLKRWLMRRERALCSGLPRPGLVIRLTANLTTAVRRDAERIKRDAPDAEAVLRRWEIERSARFGSAPVVDLDTDRPLNATVAEAVRAVWKAL